MARRLLLGRRAPHTRRALRAVAAAYEPLSGCRFQAARCCRPRGTARFSPPPRLDPSLTEHDLFIVACVVTAFALFGLGAFKARFNEKYYLRSGVETLVLGGLCALLAFVVGRFVASFASEDLR